jgi:hypothetical protein
MSANRESLNANGESPTKKRKVLDSGVGLVEETASLAPISVEDDMWSTSITFSKSTESHAGTTVHGTSATVGYDKVDIDRAVAWAEENGVKYESYALHDLTGSTRKAHFLVLRDALGTLMGDPVNGLTSVTTEFLQEVVPRLDDRFVNFQRVTQKKARQNAEIGPVGYASELASCPLGSRPGKVLSGVVISYDILPNIKRIQQGLHRVLGAKAKDLLAEVNFYGQIRGGTQKPLKECGIGFHGDGERKDVVCVILGASKEIHFNAFSGTRPIGERLIVEVGSADIYIMDEAATGNSWVKDRRVPDPQHYRHAAGPPGGNGFTPSIPKMIAAWEAKKARKVAAKAIKAAKKAKADKTDKDT